jgi:single-strand DNA-binding protein
MTKDAELKYTSSGIAYCFFSIAINKYQSKEARESGQEQKADFFDITAWRETAEAVVKYGGKGKMVAVSYHLGTRDIQKDGVTFKQTTILADFFSVLERQSANRAYNGSDDLSDDDDPRVR